QPQEKNFNFLLQQGADPNIHSQKGCTLLHYVSISKAPLVFVKILLEAKANPNKWRPNYCVTPDVMKELISAGAEVKLPAVSGGGAFGTWAFSGDLPDLIHLLIPPLSRCNYRNHQYYRSYMNECKCTRPGMTSGPAALHVLIQLSAAYTAVEVSVSGWWSPEGLDLIAVSLLSRSKRA
uniref:Uncharacterized protein n=1 Tax=Monopterus albus TaxID=43700 RepID=A0A3Q3JD53_MONAL